MGNGVELWVQLAQHEVMSCEPHFVGTSRVNAQLDQLLPDVNYPLEGLLHLWHTDTVQQLIVTFALQGDAALSRSIGHRGLVAAFLCRVPCIFV